MAGGNTSACSANECTDGSELDAASAASSRSVSSAATRDDVSLVDDALAVPAGAIDTTNCECGGKVTTSTNSMANVLWLVMW